MDNRQKEIDNLKDYKYGFSTDIESTKAPKGLSEEVIQFISNYIGYCISLIFQLNNNND